MSTNVQFDAATSRSIDSSLDGPASGTVLAAILDATRASGIDAVAELYNEALNLAKEGHYGQARDRLQVLLGLTPSDGDAHLLLAKVHVAGQQWRRALAELDEAHQCGAIVPDGLREGVLRHLHADTEADEDRTAREHREQGELKKLRSEARRLRSENAHLAAEARKHEQEAIRWVWIATLTSLVGVVGFLVVATVTFFNAGNAGDAGSDDGIEVADVQMPDDLGAVPVEPSEIAAPVVDPAVDAALPPDARVRDPGMAAVVSQALADAGVNGALSPMVRGSAASLSGSVATHADLKEALATVEGLDGIESVDASAVSVRARREGTRYTVQSGDSLSRIAYRHYGDEALHKRILDANPSLGGKPDLKIGQELVIPAVE